MKLLINSVVGLRSTMLLVMMALWMMVTISPAYATGTPPNPFPTNSASATSSGDNCTNFKERFSQTQNPNSGSANNKGMLSQIYLFIKDIVDDASKKIFENFTDNQGYQNAVYATVLLSVILFGVFFTIGVVQLTAGQLLVRLVKIAIIFTVASPDGWEFFSEYVVKVFNDGTDELVKGVLQIAAGGAAPPADSTPFYQLDKLGEFMMHPQTLISIIGSVTTGPFGLGMSALMALAFAAFVKMLIEALRIYAVCFVVRSLLLGLAPLFIVFMLFERTKQLFTTWLNSLISCSLQPILLFLFLSFFIVMIESATKNMFNTELCYVEFDQIQGQGNRISGWRFRDPETNEILTGEDTWEGPIACLFRQSSASSTGGAAGAGSTGGATGSSEECPEFPMKILDMLTFLMLVFLASRFSEVIDRVANELSSTFIALDPAGKFDQFLNQTATGGGPRGTGNQPTGTPRQ